MANKTKTVVLGVQRTRRYGVDRFYIYDRADSQTLTTTITDAAGKVVSSNTATVAPNALTHLCAEAGKHFPNLPLNTIVPITITYELPAKVVAAKKKKK